MEYSIVLRSRAFRYHIKFILLLNINSVMFIIYNNKQCNLVVKGYFIYNKIWLIINKPK